MQSSNLASKKAEAPMPQKVVDAKEIQSEKAEVQNLEASKSKECAQSVKEITDETQRLSIDESKPADKNLSDAPVTEKTGDQTEAKSIPEEAKKSDGDKKESLSPQSKKRLHDDITNLNEGEDKLEEKQPTDGQKSSED